MIKIGDVVKCVRPAGVDDNLEPAIRPVLGEVYTITGLYRMNYGVGCRLEGLDPKPYKGYLLYVRKPVAGTDMIPGWYFKKLPKVDIQSLSKAGASREALEDA